MPKNSQAKKSNIANLKNKLVDFPDQPGVYLFKDKNNKTIYIGKAKDLKKRVNSYFKADKNSKAARIVSKAFDLESIVVNSEVEALILESNLIKKHQPKYNVDLKDDKHFLYLRIDIQSDFPGVYYTRRIEEETGVTPSGVTTRLHGVSKYFGPFTSARDLRATLKLIRKFFPYRVCDLDVSEGVKMKPCLDFDLGRCLGPCLGNVSKKEYHKVIQALILFLKGEQSKIMTDIEKQMQQAVSEKNFEQAAKLRDQLKGIKQLSIKQKIVSADLMNRDFVGLTIGKNISVTNLFMVRSGRLINREYFILKNTMASSRAEILSVFVQNYYNKAMSLPKEIILDTDIEQLEILSSWLSQEISGQIKIVISKKGKKKHLIELANENAKLYLMQIDRERSAGIKINPEKALQELTKKINYKKLNSNKGFNLKKDKLFRIEGYDISNLQGKDAYGSMVVWEFFKKKKLVPAKAGDKNKRELKERWLVRLAKDQYRIFKLKKQGKPNDYAMLKEVLTRRFGNRKKHLDDRSFITLPNLILIDGGKGQLNIGSKVLKFLKLEIPIISLAKKEEIIYTSINKQGINLNERNQALKVFQKIRDESHRFSLKYHRDLRSRKIKNAEL